MKRKIWDDRGVSRIIVILLLAVIVLLVPIIIKSWNRFKWEVDKKECDIAVDSAQRKLDDEYLLKPDMTKEEAELAATSEIRSLTDTCPGGGEYVVVKKRDGNGYEIYCKLHGKE